MSGGDHLGARESAAGHQALEVQADEQRQEQEQAAGMGREAALGEREQAHVGDGIRGGPRAIRALVVGAPRQSRKALRAQHLLDGRGTEPLLPRVLELVADVVDRQVALAQGDDARPDRVLPWLHLGAVRDVSEEVAVHPMPEPPAEHAERPGLVAEEGRGLGGGDGLSKEGAQRLVLALSGVGRFPKEALFIGNRIWCFYDYSTLYDVAAHRQASQACASRYPYAHGRPHVPNATNVSDNILV